MTTNRLVPDKRTRQHSRQQQVLYQEQLARLAETETEIERSTYRQSDKLDTQQCCVEFVFKPMYVCMTAVLIEPSHGMSAQNCAAIESVKILQPCVMRIHARTHTHTHAHARICVCITNSIRTHIYIYTYIYIYTHTVT